MTERDKSAEGFLERWSRKKSEAQDAPSRDKAGEPLDAPETAKPKTEASEAPEFDISTLPSLDSITAATDVRLFMQPGVPQELTRAALRRAWAADPAIRDFRGLQENDWDFNDPDSIPGFGTFKPGEDISKLVARVFGEEEKHPETASTDEIAPASEAQTEPPELIAAESPSPPSIEPQASDASNDIVQRNINVASREEAAPQPARPRRSHGGALPKV